MKCNILCLRVYVLDIKLRRDSSFVACNLRQTNKYLTQASLTFTHVASKQNKANR